MKKIALTVLLLAGLAYAGHAFLHARAFESTDDAVVESQVVLLAPRVSGTVVQVLVGEHQQVRRGQLLVQLDPTDYETRLKAARARLEGLRQARAAARLKVDWSQTQAQASMEEARAALDSAGARVLEAESGLEAARRAHESQLHQAEQWRLQAQAEARERAEADRQAGAVQAEAERSRRDWLRYRQLYADQAISRQQLDRFETEHISARERARAARERVAGLRARVSAERSHYRSGQSLSGQDQARVDQAQALLERSRAELEEARARLHEAESGPTQVAIQRRQEKVSQAEIEQALQAVRQAELELSYTRIAAPWDGRIGRRPSEVGAYLQPGQSAVQLVSSQPWVVANFKETQLARLRAGQIAEVSVDALPGKRLKARLESLQPGTGSRFSLIPPENASGNWVKVVQRLPVKLHLEESPPELAPGMSATVEVAVR